MKKYFSLMIVLALFSGCGHLVQDICSADGKACLASIQGNYPNHEFKACGETRYGLAVCPVDVGQGYDSVGLEIQTYYQGTVRVVSENCGIDDGFSYTGNQKIRYNIPGVAGPLCLVSFVVSPSYPRQESTSIVVHSFKGHLAIIPIDKTVYRAFYGFTSHAQEGEELTIRIPVGNLYPKVKARIRGCDLKQDLEIDVKDNHAEIELRKILPKLAIKTCLISIGIDDITNPVPEKPILVSWLVAGYSKEFHRLQSPQVLIKNKRAKITAAEGVSIVALDDKFVFNNKGSFSWDANSCHTVRILTVTGRSALSEWCPEKGWTCYR